jgi:hypothetical protein
MDGTIMDMPAAQQAQLDALHQAIQPFIEWLQRVAHAIGKPLASLIEQLQQVGIFPRTKRTRRPKRRSRLRSRVALKRKGLWAASVWA